MQNSTTSFSVSWPSVLGRTYKIFWSTNLSTWTSDSIHPGTGANVTVPLDKAAIDAVDGNPGNLRSLFVRVEVVK